MLPSKGRAKIEKLQGYSASPSLLPAGSSQLPENLVALNLNLPKVHRRPQKNEHRREQPLPLPQQSATKDRAVWQKEARGAKRREISLPKHVLGDWPHDPILHIRTKGPRAI